jgi:ligand-binding SRPBCC domain-containing protein
VVYELTDEFVVGAELGRTWEFFSRSQNLSRITPPWLGFRNVTVPERVGEDSLMDHTIRWAGVPVRWRTRIVEWEPMRQFVDLQVRGPYAMWHHRHRFEAVPDGTRCEDRVLYRLPMGVVGRAVHALLVRGQLLEIFRYRRRVIGESLGWVRAIRPDVGIRPVG